MELSMGDLMDRSLDGLQFTHALLYGDPRFCRAVIPFCTCSDLFKADRHRRNLAQPFQHFIIVYHIATQFRHTDGGQLFSFCLRNIKHIGNPKKGSIYLLYLFHWFSVRPNGRLSSGIHLLCLSFFLIRYWGQDLYPLFPLLYCPVECVSPFAEASYQSGIRLLHGNKQRIVKAVVMEFRHSC